jgi:hypothetical protein
MTTGGLRDSRPRSILATVVIVATVALGLLVWWWPALTSRPTDVDVELVIGSGLSVADQSIDRRLREEGFRISRTPRPLDWCSIPELLDDLRPESTRVVVWAESPVGCDLGDAVDQVVERAGDRRVIVVHLPTDDEVIVSALDGRDVVVVDTRRLLGAPDGTMECVWWEDCPANGRVEPWRDGRLDSIGGERVARMIVTATL